MSSQTHVEISLDLFNNMNLWPPDYRVRAFYNVTEYDQCTCKEIVQRQLRYTKWNEKFTLRIVCVKPYTLGEALQLLREDHEGTVTVFDHTAQLTLLLSLKQHCECHIRPVIVPKNIIANAWGLLDRDLMKDKDGATIICSSLVPVSRDSDRVLRPTANVLKLAREQDIELLKEQISKEVKLIVQTNLKLDSSGGNGRGFVYIMQRTCAREYLKIGFSTKPVAMRNDTLKNCFEELKTVTETSNIPYAMRVESLVHTELQHFKRTLDCGECGKQHSEWFEIDITIAKAILFRWSRWITLEPYDTGTGELRPEWRQSLLENKIEPKSEDKVESIATTVAHSIKPYLKPLGKGSSVNLRSEDFKHLQKKVQAVELIVPKKSPWPDRAKQKRTTPRKRGFDSR